MKMSSEFVYRTASPRGFEVLQAMPPSGKEKDAPLLRVTRGWKERVNAKIAAEGITHEALADEIGLDQSGLSRFLKIDSDQMSSRAALVLAKRFAEPIPQPGSDDPGSGTAGELVDRWRQLGARLLKFDPKYVLSIVDALEAYVGALEAAHRALDSVRASGLGLLPSIGRKPE